MSPAPAVGQQQRAVSELVPEVPRLEPLFIRRPDQIRAGHRFEHEQVRGPRRVPAGDEAVHRASQSLGAQDHVGLPVAGGEAAAGVGDSLQGAGERGPDGDHAAA